MNTKIQLFWQVYIDLEQEFQDLARAIHINDDQQEVYSMRIADLLTRTVIEIEAIAKELYIDNGGPSMDEKDMFFDTVCIKYLNDLWKLEKKVVLVTSPLLFLEKDENRFLLPLHKAMKRGSSSSDWNKAYQAVKHNRINNLKKGNIKHFIHALAALFVLNLYLRNQVMDLGNDPDGLSTDWGLGSKIFSVKIHPCTKGISKEYHKKNDYDDCVYISQPTEKTRNRAIEIINKLDQQVTKATNQEMSKILNQKILDGSIDIDNLNGDELIKMGDEVRMNQYKTYLQKHGNEFVNAISNSEYEAVLNTQQY